MIGFRRAAHGALAYNDMKPELNITHDGIQAAGQTGDAQAKVSPLNTLPELLTKPEVAALIRKRTRTVEVYMRKGFLPYIKLGRSILFRRDAVLAHLNRFQVGN